MNDVMNLLKARKSVRVFVDREIPEEIKSEIIKSAFEAPTAGGMMLYSIINISDASIKDKLVVTCDDQPFIA
ncbi:MAG: nitroreductase family protein, partial [Mobilitalea sp.]